VNEYWSLGHHLPDFLSKPLFGDRRRFGLVADENDPDWKEWKVFYIQFYQETQKKGLGKIVNDAGYKIINNISMAGKTVLEIGPGILPHIRFWNGKPNRYVVVDIRDELINRTLDILREGTNKGRGIYSIR